MIVLLISLLLYQGGPYPVDFATQIEHMHPWTAIIAPAKLQTLSIGPFSSNQKRLTTGFDIYHTIRSLMSPVAKGNGHNSLFFDSGIPRWSYNLFQQTIPSTRNCQDAKIPKEFCPCLDERNDMAPSYYVGYSEQTGKLRLPELKYDWMKNRFAAPKLPGYLVPKAQSKYLDMSFNRNVLSPRCNATLGFYVDEAMLDDSWQLIHNITSQFPGSDVSGGIFLYKRQTILLAYLVQQQIASRAAKGGRNYLEPFRICETGFGSGHSAALFLSSAPNVEVVTFDKFDRPYQDATFSALRGYFGDRMYRVVGNSCRTVKSFKKQCDFLHGSSLCRTDNIDLIEKSMAGAILTSTAMHSLEDKSVYFGKTLKRDVKKYGEDAQWGTLHSRGCISDIVCFEDEEKTIDADLHLARGKESNITHKFCFAQNTGTCGSSKKRGTFTSFWHSDDFCPDWMIPAPVNITE